MDTEKIALFIKKVRQDNNLTQKELADKLHVTFQAVSKWENGKSIPDITILKELSQLFNVSLDEVVGGTKTKKKSIKYTWLIISAIVIIVIAIISTIIIVNNRDKKPFEFKSISTTCSNFILTGSVAYNKDLTSLSITNVEYCGENNNTIYKKIECGLYETYENSYLISSCPSGENKTITDYLKDVKINVNNYKTMCNTFETAEVALMITAYIDEFESTSYYIPITLEDNCS